MSHRPERKEKDCLNCGSIVQGKYCQACGQENTEPKETLWSMITHFFNDITHFDGKFFSTMGVLFRKPGFLSTEYIAGRRHSYLNPIRMYIFTSAVFFLVTFSMFPAKKLFNVGKNALDNEPSIGVLEGNAMARARTSEDSASVRQAFALFDTVSENKKDDSLSKPKVRSSGNGIRYQSPEAYDSAQAALPARERDNWLTRMVTRRSVELNMRYKGRNDELVAHLIEKVVHTFPYMLFVSLPLYAFFLYLLYIRHRKRLYYADHGLFLVHLYIFTFLLMLLFFILHKIKLTWDVDILNYVQAGLLIYGVIYALKAMKNFYKQRWGKTIFKFLLFNIISLIALGFLFTVFFSYTLFQD